ncbi:multi-sensor hybrid histidine kinase [Candidatus Magnetobacterium bavaricum]|uniref:Sensory/regulatory protein RpfC n=1 Tax=Candidatus Magnetobacterium bavaricum TaxID=29290 RepID=A0A0F3GZQ1_9BACT|nr:multi-sensor hybrid histidine kinase [Candidatus Magnetobacterium bavaricum]
MPIYDKNGNIVSLMLAGEDITQRIRIETRLLAATHEAESANRAKSEFLANMSHEIRTPMNGIIGLAQLMSQAELPAKQRDYLDKIQSSANSLLVIINDLLDLSKIEAGKLELEIVDFDLNNVLDDIVNILAIKAEEKEIEIIFAIDRDMPFLLVGDPLRIGQVITNLLSNAIKFTEEGEIIVTIQVVEADNDDVTLRFSVRDTGIGIPPDVIPSLFKPFSQADTSTTRKYGGTGLGLSISRKLVEMMGGEICVKSEHGKGSEFTFTIRTVCQQSLGTSSCLMPPNLTGMRVMVVDDNASTREILKGILEDFTFKVTTVDCGRAAIEQLRCACGMPVGQQYGLLLVDLKMPGMDGLETARYIQSELNLSQLPIIMMITAYDKEEAIQRSKETGLRSFLTKPVQPATLFNAILEAFAKDTEGAGIKTSRREGYKYEVRRLSAIKGARLLLVEDNYINQQVAFALLTEAGFVIDIANNGLEAVRAVEADPARYRAVLMDIQMPQMDGLEATRRIREKLTSGKLPIIAMTAHVMKEDQDKCYAVGMNAHVGKPINIKVLCDTLLKWIRPVKPDTSDVDTSDVSPALPRQDKGSLPDNLPGIDIASGLERLNCNKNLLRDIIINFKNVNVNIVNDIETAFERKNYKLARNLIHGLKGASGNISAFGLFDAARELEELVIQQDIQRSIISLERVKEQLSIVFEASDMLKMSAEKMRPPNVDMADISVGVDELTALFTEFGNLLRQNSLQAEGYFVEHQSSLAAAVSDKELGQLSGCINKLDFKGALSILRGIADALDITWE